MRGTMIELGEAVRTALAEKRPVVALESTIIAHGLPYPDNHAIACELEAAVRASGAVPATIAVFEGRLTVGLDDEKLARLAREASTFHKANASDLGVCHALGRSAATTVSATAVLAAGAGIRVFATGGIGGVHRGDSGDVSQDLHTVAETPIAVVSAGAKAILDLPRTLEMIETLGIGLVGYRTSELPAFYTRQSGLPLANRVEDARQCAAFLRAHWVCQPTRGAIIANPIPAADALLPATINAAIDAAIAAAAKERIGGKALTPYLLKKLAEVTAGQSVRANRALALANARLAGEIAVALAAT